MSEVTDKGPWLHPGEKTFISVVLSRFPHCCYCQRCLADNNRIIVPQHTTTITYFLAVLLELCWVLGIGTPSKASALPAVLSLQLHLPPSSVLPHSLFFNSY